MQKHLSSSTSIPIAAIGASAGGLEPIEQFFDSMPVDSGCAFVVVQHLSPDFRSLMDELLARHSSMHIHRIVDGMQLEANSIYLNTPRTVMTIAGNTFQVKNVDKQDTVYLPIDKFFESLAKDRGADAIGIVLSGTGFDGTKGSKRIKEAGGHILVQDPETTRFDSMPRSVITDGSHSVVAPPQELAESVQLLLQNKPLELFSIKQRQSVSDPLADVLSMLKHSHGTDFLQYKDATVLRRIERRAHMRGIKDISEYRDFLDNNEEELLDLYADLLIEVTEFFRDQDAFEILQKTVIPEITKDLKDGSAVRVWVPGCASGEEAYSIAILLQEQARSMGIYLHLKIMATDIHVRSMNQASSGVYRDTSLRNVPTDLVERYFDCADGQAQIKPSLRNMVFFSTHDVSRDPPFTRIDLISCRNLLIYLKEAAQEKVMTLLHFGLRKDGYLFLGPSEHIGKISHEFDTVNEKWRIYKKRRDIKLLASESIFQSTRISPDVTVRPGTQRTLNKSQSAGTEESILLKRAHRVALDNIVSRYAPPGFLLTDDGNIIHIFGNAGELIPLQSGTFSKRIVDLITLDLKVVVTAAIDQSRHKDFTGFHRTAYIKADGRVETTYEVSLTPLDLPTESTRFLLLSIDNKNVIEDNKEQDALVESEITEIDSADLLHRRIAILEHNLQSSEESLQSTIEELETSNEELQSTNEELMSANEEMQSTNEELHSVNEELYTVSAEHQRKNDDLTERESDINLLLQSSKIGTVHLDENLCLRRYTANALSVFNILPQDIGRPFHHITIRAKDQDILGQINSAANDSTAHESTVIVQQNAYLLRIMPYESAELKSVGVLITVIDVTDTENIKTQLAELDLHYKDIVESTESFVVRWDAKTDEILYCNQAFAQRWRTSVDKLLGRNIIQLRSRKEDQVEFIDGLKDLRPNSVQSSLYSAALADGKVSVASVSTRAISRDGKTITAYQANGFDCTDDYYYRTTLEKLFTVFTNEALQFSEKLQQILRIAIEYYSLDTGIVSMIIGETYEVVSVSGVNPGNLVEGSTLPLQDTICSAFLEQSMSLAVNDVSVCKLAELPCHQKSGIESFVGAVVNTAVGPYGTISFSSQSKRLRAYTDQEENLCVLVGSWVGFLIGNQEQIEFMSKQNEYYNSLFLTLPTMMFLCDNDGLIISASNRLCEKLGLETNIVPGKNCYQLFNVSDEDALRSAITDGDTHQLPLSFTLPDNTIMEVEISSTVKPIGTLKGVRMMVLNDVSERNAFLRTAEEQNQKLISANENLNQFAFIASHDLQEPLRKIQQFSNFLEEDLADKLTGDAKYHLNVIVDASERMSTLIYDLLRYSGASQGEPAAELVSLNDLLKEVELELELSIDESNAKIVIGQLPDIKGDKALLRQLFVNLISNSIKYRAKDRALKISVNSNGTGHQEGVTVTDNGIGFDMGSALKIFEPFNRLHNSDEYKGNGIGLAICRKVCEKHGWTLIAEGTPNVGSSFIIKFNGQIANESAAQ